MNLLLKVYPILLQCRQIGESGACRVKMLEAFSLIYFFAVFSFSEQEVKNSDSTVPWRTKPFSLVPSLDLAIDSQRAAAKHGGAV